MAADDRIDELLRLVEVEPEAMREAEFLQIQALLDALVGKMITAAGIEDTRVVITTDDGKRYTFYGFLGRSASSD
jgi:hypothetical protein